MIQKFGEFEGKKSTFSVFLSVRNETVQLSKEFLRNYSV